MCSYLLSWRGRFFFKLKYQSCSLQNRIGYMDNCLFNTYKNKVIPHANHMFMTASEKEMSTMCAYP